MKKVIIVGAGVGGLSAGIYGQLNGFDTEIFEMHTIPGGECTGWKRKDYYFDGCIHWLMGSKEGNDLNKVWNEVGALNNQVNIINHDYFYCYEEDNKQVFIYRDVKKLEAHLLEIAPEDGDLIIHMCKAIEALKCVELPTEKPFEMMNALDMGKMMLDMLPAMRYFPKLEKISIEEYANKFKSKVLRNALIMLIPPHFKATALIATIASMADGDSGWPEGGSLEFAKRMEQKYKYLGGRVSYKSKVKEIIIEDGVAKGIILENGTKHYGDYVISAADGYNTIFKMLGGRYIDQNIEKLYSDSESYPVYSTVQVSLGVNYDLEEYPHTRFIPLHFEIDGGGKSNNYLGFRHFGFDKTLMPNGKNALIIMLHGDFNWWKEKYNDQEVYKEEKNRLANDVIKVVEDYYPELRNKIEVVDVATPMTYVRYCDAWQGAWMAWATTPKGKIRFIPGILPGLKNFYLAGQWTLLPGGLPSAAITGKWVIQRICKAEKIKFKR